VINIQKLNDRFELIFYKLHKNKSFHNEVDNSVEQKYGQNSLFSQIKKFEKPSVLHYYLQSMQNVKIETRKKILNLGINHADEFEVIQKNVTNFKDLELLGIDYSKSAIASAKEKFKEYKNVSFKVGDINNLKELGLETYDLIITIGTLQSTGINFNEKFMEIVQHYLKKDGSIILGFPNCRWIDGEIIYGAKAKNYSFSELSLLYKDVIFCKKYLQQKKFRVTITGKDYIFLTATSIR
jgi:2-polyprenyl-3-methyl-5-hydroxy-6-metoxy-1,4-benzoquinol methylase